jgi:hypothetical protein
VSLDERIEQALHVLPDDERAAHLDRGGALTRRQMMNLVTGLEQLQAPSGTQGRELTCEPITIQR